MTAFGEALERYHETLRAFVKGDPAPTLEMFSRRDDVVLCNPLHPFARGPQEVEEAITRAASQFTDGTYEFEPIVTFATDEVGYIVEIERFNATVAGSPGSGALRVTVVFRREEGEWRVAHRHADPITTPRSAGSIVES